MRRHTGGKADKTEQLTHLILLQNGIEYQVFHGPTSTDSEFQSHVEDGRSKCVTVWIAAVSKLTGALGTSTENCRGRHDYGGEKDRVLCERESCKSRSINKKKLILVEGSQTPTRGASVATHGVVEQVCKIEKDGVDASPSSGDQIEKVKGQRDKTG
jgi:hypothetical protein